MSSAAKLPDSFDDRESVEAWDSAADAWEEFVESGADYYRTEVHGPALLSTCGDVRGLRVLDVGCGQGWFSRQLALKGAQVTGIDISSRQIENALKHEERSPLGIEYRIESAAESAGLWKPGSFDLATGCMSFQDMADVGAAFAAVRELLVENGRLVISVSHPGTDTVHREWELSDDGSRLALKIDRYFDTGPRTVNWSMERLVSHWESPAWRRTLTEWSKLIAEAGFVMRRMNEPRPTREQIARQPALEDAARLPMFLIFDLICDDRS
ncbi:MAG: methyltransferase domain-containing protein [Chloroflexi bacterium]|nr:methyltransferase domain-containing protein [Chloroflexota bacterium]MCY3937430.1 methyltransferase domain-containing protein [Chloroflexota bacterium]